MLLVILAGHLILWLTLKLAATKQEAVETERNARNHFYDIHLGSSINYVFSFSQNFDPSHPDVTTFLHGCIDQFFLNIWPFPPWKGGTLFMNNTLLRAGQCLGSFNNYVDIIFVFFDHLSTSMWIFFTQNVNKNPIYPPHLVHVVFERPIAGISPTTYWPNSLFLSIQVEETGKHTFQKLLHSIWLRIPNESFFRISQIFWPIG